MSTGSGTQGDAATPSAPADHATVDEQLLMAVLAQRYYLENRTKTDIAAEFGLSRFKVSRLLETAVSTRLVRIEVVVPESLNADLSLRVKDTFGLQRALVVSTRDPRPQALRDSLGRAAAALLSDCVSADDVLGVSAGRTVDAMARHLTRLAGCEIVQLTGMSGNLDDNPVEVLRRVAVLSGGRARTIYAPLTVATSEAARALKTDPRIADAFARFSSVTIAVVSVGSWAPPESRFHDALTPVDRQALLERGVVADLSGVLLDAQGRAVPDFDDRVLGASVGQLRAMDQVVVVGGGPRKARAVLAALKSGLVTTLVTDDSVAQHLLSSASGRPR